MVYRITAEPDYLRAELFDRETVEETQDFLRAVVRDNAKHRRPCVLILVRVSKPIFQVVPHRLIEYIEKLSGTSASRIALVGDTMDLHISHEYIELLARQRRLNVRSFRSESVALQWLKDQRKAADRRRQQDRREPQDRRQVLERREQERRASPAIPHPQPAGPHPQPAG
jgi:hypothetical protein